MAALVWCRGNVYYEVDYLAAIGGKYRARNTQTEKVKQSKVACNERNFISCELWVL
jgi:hypothetical protein